MAVVGSFEVLFGLGTQSIDNAPVVQTSDYLNHLMETTENFCCFDYIKKDFLIFLKRGLLSNSEDRLTALVYMKKSALKSDVHL